MRCSERPIELEAVLARIPKMELSCAPRSIRWRRPRAALIGAGVDPAALNELSIDRINVSDNKPVGRAIGGICPLLRIGPLKMDLDTITRDSSVLRLARIVLERQREPKAPVEFDRSRYVT